VVGGDVEDMTGFGVDPEHGLPPVVLDGHDACDAVGVEDLRPHCVVLHQASDGDEAGGCADQRVIGLAGTRLLRNALDADVEPDRGVEGRLLVDDDVFELVGEGPGLLGVVEVAVLQAPFGDGVDHPVDDLAERGLALVGPRSAPEVLLGQDVGGVQGPGGGDLDGELLEGHGAVSVVGDARVAPLPDDLVVGMDPIGGEVTPDADGGPLRGNCH
jgi:hypothetical protein